MTPIEETILTDYIDSLATDKFAKKLNKSMYKTIKKYFTPHYKIIDKNVIKFNSEIMKNTYTGYRNIHIYIQIKTHIFLNGVYTSLELHRYFPLYSRSLSDNGIMKEIAYYVAQLTIQFILKNTANEEYTFTSYENALNYRENDCIKKYSY